MDAPTNIYIAEMLNQQKPCGAIPEEGNFWCRPGTVIGRLPDGRDRYHVTTLRRDPAVDCQTAAAARSITSVNGLVVMSSTESYGRAKSWGGRDRHSWQGTR